jgi:hypothetical protein
MSNLMCSSCFQLARDQRHITKTFQHLVVRNCWLPYLIGKDSHLHVVSLRDGHITFNCSCIGNYITPHKRHILLSTFFSNCFARCDIAAPFWQSPIILRCLFNLVHQSWSLAAVHWQVIKMILQGMN